MNARVYPLSSFARLLASLLSLALVAFSCGGGGTTVGGGKTSHPHTPTPTATATPGPADVVRLNDASASTVSGMRVDLIGLDGLPDVSETQPYPALGITCSPILVLNPPPTGTVAVFSQSSIVAIQTYLDTVSLNGQGFPIPDTTVPPSLHWVAGGGGVACNAELQILNEGSDPLQIDSLGIQLTAASVANQYQYPLVDICTTALNAQRYDVNNCPEGASEIGTCGNATEIHIMPGSAGAEFSGQVHHDTSETDPTCPTPLIQPGDITTIGMTILNDSRLSLVFQVIPVITMTDTATGLTSTVVFPTLNNTLVYSTTSQYTCYGLRNGTLQQISQLVGDGHYCI